MNTLSISKIPLLALGLAFIYLSQQAFAQSSTAPYEISIDTHFRIDNNQDIRGLDGDAIDDYSPYRFRIVPQIAFKISENADFATRVRGEYDHNGKYDQSRAFFDKYVLRQSYEKGELWLGRNDYPFWKQNYVIWDGDITPAGLFASHYIAGQDHTATFSGGYFYLPKNQSDFEDRLAALQIALTKTLSYATLTYAASINSIQSDANIESDVVANSIQAIFDLADRPLKLGYDFYWNAAASQSDDSAHIFNIAWGSTKKAGGWKFGADKVVAESNSIYNPYAKKDWLRFKEDITPSGVDGGSFWIKYAVTDHSILSAEVLLRNAKINSQESTLLRFELNSKF